MLNLTPHAITLVTMSGEEITLAPSGTIARVEMTEVVVGICIDLSGEMPVIRRVAGAVVGLPTDGSPCLVSAMVLAAIEPGTAGVYAPDTGSTAVRNSAGHIVAVTRLVAA